MITDMRSPVFYQVGGWLTLLVVLHFTVDWVFQSHDEAMRKPREWAVRARHCLVYTTPFAVLLCTTTWDSIHVIVATWVVFLSHFVEDTYIPVLIWAKYVRRPPQMGRRIVIVEGRPLIMDSGVARGFRSPKEVDLFAGMQTLEATGIPEATRVARLQRELDLDGFVTFVSEPLGKILLVAIDQIVHVLFLLPIAYMMAVQP
jgi:hypothetical protein